MNTSQKTKAFVTGANGFVGSHLVDLLLKNNYDVTCLVRKSSNLQWLADKAVTIADCGFNDVAALTEALKGVAYVFHVAGVVKAKERLDYFRGNVHNTKNLLDACVANAETIKKVLIVSSETAAGPSPSAEGISEDYPAAPITTYGISKLSEERLVHDYMPKLPITIARPPAVYGERDTEVFIFFNSYCKGVTTTIGFEKKLLSLIHVSDLVRGIYLAAIAPNTKGETYFITSKDYYSWEQIIDVTRKITGKKALRFKVPHPIVYLISGIAQFISYFQTKAATLNIEKARDITQTYWICSPAKAKRDFQFESEIDLEEGIGRTIAWYHEQKWL
jgi:nucleoside-diphosphate-sugar epimerase